MLFSRSEKMVYIAVSILVTFFAAMFAAMVNGFFILIVLVIELAVIIFIIRVPSDRYESRMGYVPPSYPYEPENPEDVDYSRSGGLPLFGRKDLKRDKQFYDFKLTEQHAEHGHIERVVNKQVDTTKEIIGAQLQVTQQLSKDQIEIARINAQRDVSVAEAHGGMSISAGNQEFRMAELAEQTKERIALDTNQSKVKIASNQLDFDAAEARRKINDEITLMEAKVRTARPDTVFESQVSLDRLRIEADELAEIEIMRQKDPEMGDKFFRRWIARRG